MATRYVRLPLAVLSLMLLVPAGDVAAQDEFQNLQVLPSDISRPELTGIMRTFTSALGMRCSSCHVGEEGQPLSAYDMASDDKPLKLKAREMLRMVQAINGDFLADLPDRGDPPVRVTCDTCHGGVSRPETLAALLTRVAVADGGDAAVARYRELRERYLGGRAYDLRVGSVLDAMAGLVEAGDAPAALSLGAMAEEFFPGVAAVHVTSGQAHEAGGDTAAAVAAYRRALEIDPDNRVAFRRIEALGGQD